MLRPTIRKGIFILAAFAALMVLGIDPIPAQSQENRGLVIPTGDSAALVRALEQANQAGTETALDIYLQAGQYILYAPNEVGKPALPVITGAVNLFGQNTLILLYSETASPAQMIIVQGATVELHHLHFLPDSGTGRAVINHGTLRIYDSYFGSLDREVLPGVGEGRGIENYGSLSIERTTFTRNQYLSTNTEGGAIYNAGTLTASCTRFVEGLASRGGAVFNTGSATISNSAFEGNIANGGGAIFSAEGTVDATSNWWSGLTPGVNDLYLGTNTISTGVNVEPASPSDPTQDGTCEVQPPAAIPDEVSSSPAPADSQTFVVTTTADSGAGSLRQAILDANSTTDADTISFNIPAGSCPGGVCTITPLSDLPIITSPVTLDGTTQSGASCPGTPRIQIQGSAARAYGLRLNNLASGSLIKGLIIGGFSSSATAPGARGIFLDNADSVKIQCSFIGVNAAGTAANSNRIGIGLESGVSGAIIGTDGDGVNDEQERNLISGNILAQIYIGFTGTANSNNRIAGNYIGVNAAGTAAISPAATSGIFLFAGASNLIGTNADGISDALEANLISGNGVGVELRSANNRVSGNIIGLNTLKTSAVPNTTGIFISGTSNTLIGTEGDGVGDVLEGNLISGNTQYGIRLLGANNNRIAGNVIGLNGTGTSFIGNGTGIYLDLSNNNIIGADGSFNPLHRNVIAGNNADGIQVNSSSNGNRISMNRIYQNGTLPTHLGIDLTSTDGVNLNDSGDTDTGPNRLVNYPIISTISTNQTTQATINASISSSANTTFRVEVYSSPSCDPSGNGEGRTFRAGFTVTTNASGVTPANVTVDIPSDEPYFTLIAIQASGAGVGDTSEFSPCATFVGSFYEVTTTGDSGVGSLRQALLDANSSTDYSRVSFNIPASDPGCVDGVCTIALSTALPQINTQVILDGTTQSGTVCPDSPRIAIRLASVDSTLLHLNVHASGSLIKGLILYGDELDRGIWLDHSSHNTLACNFVGILPDGITWGHIVEAVVITNGTHNRIGTDGDGVDDLVERNLIAGRPAVLITGVGSTHNRVSGNYLNMEINGDHALLYPAFELYTGFSGVEITNGASYNLVGTDGIGANNDVERNIIAARQGNTGLKSGVAIDQAHYNTIAGNYIGTNKTGNAPSYDISLGDYLMPIFGVSVVNGSTYNLIGTNSDNQGDTDERNVIAGYIVYKIWIGGFYDTDPSTQYNQVSGNYVGINAAGTAAVGGDRQYYGAALGPSASYNLVGTNGDGVNDLSERNVIAGNAICDIYVLGDNNRVSGNYIGVNAAGTGTISTTVSYLMHIIVGDDYWDTSTSSNIIGTNGDGISDALEGNLISGISPMAIRIAATGSTDNRIAGNTIGLGADGSTILSPTTSIYIELNAQNTLIGSNNDGISDDMEGNIITAQTNAAVRMLSTAGVGNRLSRNRIYGVNAIGIDLNDDGITPNDDDDGDSGPNNLQNTPILTGVLNGGETVTGALNSTPNRAFRLEFFANESCAEAAYKAGKTYIGALEVTTDANGDAAFSASGLKIVFNLQGVTATATDMLTGDTSEFSVCAAATESIYIVTTTADSGVGSLRQALLDANGTPELDKITFYIPASDPGCVDGVCTIALSTELPLITAPVNLDGINQPGANCLDGPRIVITMGYPYPYPRVRALHLTNAASGSAIRGLVIQHVEGIWLDGSDHNIITCNFIGVSSDGMSLFGTTFGVHITNGAHNWIGTDGDGVDDLAERNLIAAEEAVSITGSLSTFNRVSGNYLNMKIDGDHLIFETPPSGYAGCLSGVILRDNASYNLIGTDGIGIDNEVERNLIAAYHSGDYGTFCQFGLSGLPIGLDNAHHNTIAGNYIGVNRAGDATSGGIPRQGTSFIYQYSVSLENGSSYNVIGTNGDGQGDVAERNLLSGDAGVQIAFYGTGSDHNTVAGNYIGVNALGTEVITNGGIGVQIGPFTAYNVIGTNGDGNNDGIEGNVIAGHWASNLLATGSHHRIAGNYLGVNAAGTALLLPINGLRDYISFDLSIGYVVGGNQGSPAYDIIFGTNGDGISDDLEGNVVASAIPITFFIIVETGTSGNIIAGNLFGVGADKTTIIAPNTLIQIDMSAHNTLIGSNNDGISDDLEGNIIAAQANAGIKILSNGSVGNRLSRNRIYGVNAIGIDLNDDGITPNDTGDGDSGPNNLQNTPILTGVLNGGETVTGTLNSTANRTFRLEFFANESCAEAAYKAGKTYIGALEVTTDANGDAAFSASGLVVIPNHQAITATATDMVTGDTSEFSICATNTLPATITQIGPSGNITSRAPTFTWQKEANSTSYELQVVRNDVTVIHAQNYSAAAVCGASTCSVAPALDLDSEYYSWWVRGVNTSGNGPWSGQGFAMTILPGLVTQAAPIGAYNGRSPTFTWDRERDSHEYGIWIGQGSTTLHLAYIQASTYCNSTTCSYTPPLDLSSDYYVWWIGGYSLGGGGDWTGTGFHVTVLPGLLTQTAPIGAYNGRTPTFTWDRDRDSHEYGIWIGQGGTTLHLAYIQASTYCNLTTCSYTPALDLSSDYYTWWVGGYSLGGGGPWNGNGFHVTVTPATVVQLGPQGTISQSNPSFTWQRDRDSLEYGIWIGQGSTPVHQTTVQTNTVCPSQTPGSTCTYTPTLNLAPGGYSWWIGGYSLGGGGPWSGMSFTHQ